jgi:hypothetical protein
MRKSSRSIVMLAATVSMLIAAPLVYASRGDDARSSNTGHGGWGGTRWAMVDETGAIAAQSGGFNTVNCFQANANCYLDIGTDATAKGLSATIADQNNVAGQGPSLTGEIGVGACGIGQINCAPPGTENPNVIVVSPRNSDGSETTPTTRKRFYVQVLGKPAR